MTAFSNPYVGPRAFKANEVLYGRERELRQLESLLIAERIVLLHSPSGAGKTSLIQAGLSPRLREQEFSVLPIIRVNLEPPDDIQKFDGFNRYTFSAMVSLEEGVDSEKRLSHEELAGLDLDSYLLRQYGSERDLVLIFDQFEEVLTSSPVDTDAKAAFFSNLGEALYKRERWALLSIREDYLGALAPYLRPIPGQLESRFRLDLLNLDAAKQAIKKPALVSGVEFLDEAVQKLVDDLRVIQVQQPDGSFETAQGLTVEPVQLQVVCFNLWQSGAADDGLISPDDLQNVGSVGDVLATYYADSLTKISVNSGVEERVVRQWFHEQLITSEGIRGQALRGVNSTAGLPNHVLTYLENAYLIRGETRAGKTWYELAHDRLVEPILRNNEDWFNANLNLLEKQTRLWVLQQRPDGLLIHGDLLGEAEKWAKTHQLSSDEADFLSASKRERRNTRVRTALTVFALIGLLLAVAFGINAQKSAREARENAIAAEAAKVEASANEAIALKAKEETEHEALVGFSNQLVAQSFLKLRDVPDLAMLLSAEAFDIQNTAQTRSGLLTSLTSFPNLRTWLHGHYDVIYALAVSPDGRKLASGGQSGQVIVWDLTTGIPIGRPLTGNISRVLQLAFSPDGSKLASSDDYGIIMVWDLSSEPFSGTPIYAGYYEPIYELAFSADGQWLISGGEEVSIWSMYDHSLVKTYQPESEVHAMDNSPADQNLIAYAGNDNQIRLWNSDTDEVSILGSHLDVVLTMDFSPDGQWLATAGEDAVIQLWNVNDKTQDGVFLGHSDDVLSVAFTPDSESLVSAGYDGQIILWDIDTHTLINEPILGHAGFVNDIAISPDGHFLFSAGEDRRIGVWSLEANTIFSSPVPAHSGEVRAIEFATGMNRAVSIGSDNKIRVWNTDNWEVMSEISSPHQGNVSVLSVDPDGSRFVTGGDDRQIYVWTQKEDKWASNQLKDHTGRITSLSFSRDRKFLASTDSAGNLFIWDTSEWKLLNQAVSGTPTEVNFAAFSPVDDFLIVGGGKNITLLESEALLISSEETVTGDLSEDDNYLKELIEAILSRGEVYTGVRALAFNTEANLIAVSYGAEIRFYDTDTRQLTGQSITGYPGKIISMDVSPDGSILATLSDADFVLFWDLGTQQAIGRPVPVQGTILAFDPVLPALVVGKEDGEIAVWNMDPASWRQMVCQVANRNLNASEWDIYLANKNYEQTCPEAPDTSNAFDGMKEFLLGEEYYRLSDYDLAIRSFERTVQVNPNSAYAYNYLAWASYYNATTEEEYEQAVNYFNRSIEINPLYVDSYHGLGTTYSYLEDYEGMLHSYLSSIEVDPEVSYGYRQVGWAYYYLENYEQAEANFKKAIEVAPSSAIPYADYADYLDSGNRYEEAIEMYLKAIERNPKYTYAFRGVGWAYYYLGDYQTADAYFKRIIEISPNNAYEHGQYGNFLDSVDRYEEAIKMYLRAAELDPDYTYAYRGIGWAYYYLDDYDTADTYFKRVTEISPDSAYEHGQYGYFLRYIERYEEAIKVLLTAVKLDPKYTYAYRQLGWSNYYLDDYQTAETYFKKTLEIAPDDEISYANYGDFLDDIDRYQEAISMYLKAVELNPEYYWAWKQLGWAYHEAGDEVKAEEALIKGAVLAAKKSDAWYYANLGDFYRNQLDDNNKALDAYQRAIETDPRYIYAYQQMGRAYYSLEDYKTAETYFQKTFKIAPDDGDTYANYGNFLDDIDRYQEAISMYLKAVELNPEYYWAWKQLGWAYHEAGDEVKAEEALIKGAVLAAKKSDAWYYANLGDFYRNQLDDNNKALDAYQRAIETDPRYIYAYQQMGRAYYSLEDYKTAETYFKKTMEIAPDDEDTYATYGNFLDDIDRYEEAISMYLKAVELNPEYYWAWKQLGWAYHYSGDEVKAEEALIKGAVLAAKKSDAWYYANLGDFYRNQLDDNNKALDAYQRAIETDLKYIYAYQQTGWAYYSLDDYETAETYFKKTLEMAPDDEDTYATYGNFLDDIDRYEEAISMYLKAVELNPRYIYAYQQTGWAYYYLEDYRTAETYFKKTLEIAPDDEDTYATYGNFLDDIDRYQEAISMYLKAIELNPEYYWAWRQLGWAYHEAGDDVKAEEALIKGAVLAAKKSDAWYYANLGDFYRNQLDDNNKALDAYQRAIETNPEYTFAYRQIGWAYYYLDDYKTANSYFKRVTEISPDSAYEHGQYGYFLRTIERYEEAIKVLLTAVKLDPKYIYAYQQTGWAYYSLDDNETAETYFQKTLEIAPDDEDTYATYGNFLDDIDRYEEAISMYLKAVELNPEYYWAWKQLGWAYHYSGDEVKAEEALIKGAVLAAKKSDAWYYANLGDFYQNQLDDNNKALDAYQRAIETDPRYIYAYQQMGRAYYSLEDYRTAETYFKKTLEIAPDDEDTYATYGNFLDDIDRYQEAISMYLKAVELNPEYYWAWKQLGWAYHEAGDEVKAEEALVKGAVLAAKKSDAWYYANLGDFYRNQLDDNNKALQSYLKAVEIDPGYYWAWNRLGWAYHAAGDDVKAEEALVKGAVLAAKKSDAWYYANLGDFYKDDLDKPLSAVESYLKAIEIDPGYTYAYQQAGWAYNSLGEQKTADTYFKKALEITPISESTHVAYGDFLSSVERYEEAIRIYLKAVELNPNYYWAWNRLGWAYHNHGDNSKATEALIKAANLSNSAWYYANLGDFYSNELGDNAKALSRFLRAIELSADYSYAYRRAGDIYYNLGNKTFALRYYKSYVALVTNPSTYILNRINEISP
jgi:tetratricopeptide (TPR) repeat protein/WD40 repeat protein